jgi:anti-sigma B factor antagonist
MLVADIPGRRLRSDWLGSLVVPSLELSESTESGIHIFDLRGELDISTVRVLHQRLVDAIDEEPCVVLDCMGLTFIDSSGMRLLLSALRLIHRQDGCLVVACANPTVLRLFAVTGMDKTFDVVPSREDAVAKALAAGHGEVTNPR